MNLAGTQKSPFPVGTELLVACFGPDLTIQDRNKAWKSVFGSSSDIWSGMTTSDQQLSNQYLNDAAKGTLVTNQVFFVQLVNRDQPLPILLHFIPVAYPDTQTEHQRCITVTGEALVEPGSWVLNQTQRIRVENIGRMTLGLIHEINNMLTNVLGNLEIIKLSNLLPEGNDELKTILRTIRKAALDGASMTKSIKSYIRNEKTSTFALLDLTELIEDCVSFTKPYWYNEPRRTGIEIDLVTHLDELPPIWGSDVELKEVFINLITNAVQAMPRGGQLAIKGSMNNKGEIVIRVIDTGNGMPDKVKQRIFEPMFTTKGEHGTGMGLSICMSIVQNHDAKMDVESEIGQGTTFVLTFKPSDIEEVPQDISDKRVESTPVNILAVDDEPGVRNILANLLKTKGHAVSVASSGYEALDQLKTKQVDIVFTDHGMPEMNGHQLAQAIRQTNPDLPIVLVTGDTEFEYQMEEIDAIIGKPFFLEDLQRVIDDLLITRECVN